jgi:hypothetical protein
MSTNARLKETAKRYKKIIDGSEHAEELLRAIAVRDQANASIEGFSRQCREEMADWQERIEELKTQSEGDGTGTHERLRAMVDQYQAEWDRVQGVLGAKMRELLRLRTDYDEVPTMAELTQYDRRLHELGALGLGKLTELRKCHHLYNSLVESEEILARENELFNSILKSFNQAVNKESLRPGLIAQMTDIARQTTERRNAVTADVQKKRQALALLDEKHRALLEQQRRYFQVVKEYQIAYETLSRLRGHD